MNERKTRWIIGSVAAALWATIVVATAIELSLRWYLAIWLAALVASCMVLAFLVDGMAKVREERSAAALRAAINDGVQDLCTAIDQHGTRMEVTSREHGDKLAKSVLSAERWLTNGWRAEKLAQMDAAAAKAAQLGDETGPLPIVRGRCR
ncbi:hypothetical protein [Nonomuraea pusilla]|uniref:Uncharacterized protein n=1 Tax=Nonomuraea pusilla TaxID=46177 RepID=A0A1H8KEP5_9ACTN|nr:hypothetical protein [Nonomuraea pusilla]SEN91354.1 hypothetical protein SAMN05660976_08588 [Nonomuraea pusilla]